jgi:AcrR family transcriptional regulator
MTVAKAPEVNDSEARTRIFAAALRLLSDEGSSSLTVRKVATEAGCSTIGVYTWFGGKDGLIDAIWIDGFRSFAGALRRVRPLDEPMGRLQAQAHAYRRWALKHPRHYKIMFLGGIADHVPGDEAQRCALSAFAELQRGVNEAIAKGDLITADDMDANAVAMAMWGIAHGLVSIELVQSGPPELAANPKAFDHGYDVAINAMLRGFGSPKV